jgi:hypothetical protein
MKTILVLLFITALTASSFAQPKGVKEFPVEDAHVKTQLEHIFKLCGKNDCASVAPLVVYKGTDTTRRFKDVLDYSKAGEKEQADGICSTIAGQQKNAKKITYDQFFLQKEKTGMWYYWKVHFTMKTGEQDSASFGFVKIKDAYILANVSK